MLLKVTSSYSHTCEEGKRPVSEVFKLQRFAIDTSHILDAVAKIQHRLLIKDSLEASQKRKECLELSRADSNWRHWNRFTSFYLAPIIMTGKIHGNPQFATGDNDLCRVISGIRSLCTFIAATKFPSKVAEIKVKAR